MGIYLGHSPCHAGNVALVLNPKTLQVSPQFHLVFDDEFLTVSFMRNGEIPPHWTELVWKSAELATPEEFNLATSWANNYIANDPVSVDEEDGNESSILLNGTKGLPVPHPGNKILASEEAAKASGDTKRVTWHNQVTVDSNPREDQVDNQLMFPTLPDLNELTCHRSKRVRKPRTLMSLFVACAAVFTASIQSVGSEMTMPATLAKKAVFHAQQVNQHYDGTLNVIHHAFLTVEAGDNDTYTLKEMLKQEDKNEFIQVMMKEVADHESRNHWTVLPRSEIPNGVKTILVVWSFKRKQSPDGRILKHKARLCAHGGMQTWGVNYWETYAPVVNWMSVRMLMILSIINDLETRSIDFVLAFPQAPLEVDIFMEPPFGFDIDGKKGFILKLNKNLYGLKNASQNFWNLLKDGLQARGYQQQSESDPCVFIGKDCVILTYHVDDCILLQRKR